MTVRDEVTFSEVFRTMYDDVRAFLAHRTDPQVVDDLAAEVFTRAWSGWLTAPEPPGPWIYGIARHLLTDRYRAEERRRRLLQRIENQRPPGDEEVAASDSILDLAAAWHRLTDGDREVLALTAWDGLTGAEAAAALGCARAAYSVRLTRARRRMRRLLEEQTSASATPTLTQTGAPALQLERSRP